MTGKEENDLKEEVGKVRTEATILRRTTWVSAGGKNLFLTSQTTSDSGRHVEYMK